MSKSSPEQSANHELIGLFAKLWAPGSVKTRLARAIGAEKASQVYRAFLDTMLDRLSQTPCEHVLAYAPGNEATCDAFKAIIPENWSLVPQVEGDLGQRMSAFFQGQFEHGAHSVVLLGSDSPNLPMNYVQQAFLELKTHPVVLGPTDDGGYYLVGISERVTPIFDGIPWSTSEVWNATIEQLQQLNSQFAVLPPWYDVDEIDDLNRLLQALQDHSDTDRSLADLFQHLKEILDPQAN